MPARLRRSVTAVVVALLAMAGVLVLPATAAAAAGERTFRVTGDPDDRLTGGRTHDHSTDRGDGIHAVLVDPGHAHIRVDAVDGVDWRLELAAPAGRVLGPGTYSGAGKWPLIPPPAPGLDLGGDGPGCRSLAGTFTIAALVLDRGRVVELDAGFEVRCDGAAAAARGRVRIAGPQPGPLAVAVEATGGTVDATTGHITLDGTLGCTEAALVEVRGEVVQPAAGSASGRFDTYLDCTPGAPVEWDAIVPHATDEHFRPGPATVSVTAVAVDPGDGSRVEAEGSGSVALTGSG